MILSVTQSIYCKKEDRMVRSTKSSSSSWLDRIKRRTLSPQILIMSPVTPVCHFSFRIASSVALFWTYSKPATEKIRLAILLPCLKQNIISEITFIGGMIISSDIVG